MIGLTLAVAAASGLPAAPPPKGAAPGSASPPPKPAVTFRDGRLSVDATDVPTMTLLARIADVTGATVSGTVTEPAAVTISFRDVPVRQAIDRIVGDTNFTLRYGADGTLRRISLRGRSLPPPTRGRAKPRHGRILFQRAWLKRPAEKIPRSLAEALGAERLPLPRLLRSLRTLQDASLRREAVTTFVRSIERDPVLRRSWRAMQPAEVASFMRQQAGPQAREAIQSLAAVTQSARMRAQAAAALPLVTTPKKPAR